MREPIGFLLVNKPQGVTSRKVVDAAERLFPSVKIGHCGTLDPIAEGLVVVAVGRARRLIQFVQELPKRYRATMQLGVTSETWDTEAPLVAGGPYEQITEKALRAALERFLGEIEQVPPVFSAVRVQGRRAYELARRGKAVQLKPKRVRIYRLELLSFSPPHVEIEVECGGGTYIRALIRDIGQLLGCGAVMTGLVRTAIGPFRVEQASSLEELQTAQAPPDLAPPQLAVQHLARANLDETQVRLVRHGRPLRLSLVTVVPPEPNGPLPGADWVALYGPEADLVAIGECDQTARLIRPRIVLQSN